MRNFLSSFPRDVSPQPRTASREGNPDTEAAGISGVARILTTPSSAGSCARAELDSSFRYVETRKEMERRK